MKRARRSLDKVRLKLLAPTTRALDSSASDIEVAVDSLKKLEAALASGQRRTPEWRRSLELELRSLSQDLRDVNALLAAAGQFYAGWACLVSTAVDDAPANYTAQGTPHPPLQIRSSKVVQIG